MRKSKVGYLFVLPIFIFFLTFFAYPIFFTINTSFYKWNGMSAQKTFVGLHNYTSIFNDKILLIILKNFLIFAAITIFTQMILGLIFALMFKKNTPFSGFFKTILFMPVVLTPTIVAVVFSKILEFNMGFFNEFLRSIGLGFLALQWLANPNIAIFSLAGVNIWQWTGFSMIMYMAGLSTIPEDMFEAAKIDGASKVKTFLFVTWPMLRNTHYTLTILGIIGVLQTYDIVFILTKGGPNNSTQFFTTYIVQKAFESYDAGYSSVLSIILLLLALLCTAVQLNLYNRKLNEV